MLMYLEFRRCTLRFGETAIGSQRCAPDLHVHFCGSIWPVAIMNFISVYCHIGRLSFDASNAYWGVTPETGIPLDSRLADIDVNVLESYDDIRDGPECMTLLPMLLPMLRRESIHTLVTDKMFPELDGFVSQCPNLTHLQYTVHKLPSMCEHWPPLRSLTIGCWLFLDSGNPLPDPSWQAMVLDMEKIETSGIYTLVLLLTLVNTSVSSGPKSIQEYLALQDWAPIGTFVQRCKLVKALRIQVRHPCDRFYGFIDEESQLCRNYVLKVALEHLPKNVGQMLEMM